MPQILTDALKRSIAPPPTGTSTLWDGGLKSFGLRVNAGGAKTFIVLIGSGRRLAIELAPENWTGG